jgi:hypothetical protein
MSKIQRNVVGYIPLKIIPVATFNTGLPTTIYQSMDLAGKASYYKTKEASSLELVSLCGR